MSVHPTKKHPSYAPARIFAIAGSTLVASLAFTGVAAATTSPTFAQGNPRCAAGLTEVKIDPVPQGFTRFAGGSITVDDRTFDWTTTQGVDVVIVKGGPNANIYDVADATSGTDFQAPRNPSNGQPYGLSHISFCSDGKQTPPPVQQPDPGPQNPPTDTTPRVEGNPTCADVGAAGLRELKIDPVPQGRTGFGDGTIAGAIDVKGVLFDWAADQGVDVVIVKGGPNASVYRADEAPGGTGLHAPINPSNGQPYGLSHITFCYDADQAPPATTCPEGTTQMTDGTCKAPETKPTCPEGTTPMTDGTCKAPETKPTCPEGTTVMADGTCKADETPEPAPCEAGGPMTKPDGSPCTQTSSEPPVVTTTFSTPESSPTPVSVTVASRTEPGRSQVLGATGVIRKRVAANAKMQGPKRCVTRPFRQALRGQGVKRVTILVNGKKVRTFTGARSTYAITIDPRKYRTGVIRVSARVEYVAASRKKAQTLRLTVLRCAAQAGQQVRFAG